MDSAFRSIAREKHGPLASTPTFIEDSGKNSSLWERSTATASLSLERGNKWLDTFPQCIRHITKIFMFPAKRLPAFRKSKNMPDILLILPESFRAEVVKGYAETRAVRVLREAGWLRTPSKNRLKHQERLPGLGRVRVYLVCLPDDPDEESAHPLPD